MKIEPRQDSAAIQNPAGRLCGRHPSNYSSGNHSGYFVAIAVLTVALSTGCSAKLTVSKELAGNSGLPIRVDVPVIVTTTTQFRALPVDQVNRMLPPAHHKSQAEAASLCATPEVKEALALAPMGEQYFVNIDPADLAKNEFSVEWSDNGRLKKVSMNSDPSATIKESAAALETLLPFVGVTAEAPAAAEAANEAAAGGGNQTLMGGLTAAPQEPLPAASAKAVFCIEASSSIKTRLLPSP